MRVKAWLAILFVTLAAGHAAAQQGQLDCSDGPLLRTFAGQQWNVFSCSDRNQMVVFALKTNPAYLSYILLRHRNGKLETYSEGNGDEKIRKAAQQEIERLSDEEVSALRAAVLATPKPPGR